MNVSEQSVRSRVPRRWRALAKARQLEGRNACRERLRDMGQAIEETYWTAKEWSLRTRIPYRTILAAVSRDELPAARPSGTAHGCIHISESSWSLWMRRTRPPVRVPGRIGSFSPGQEQRPLRDLALG
jgi:hypothetical protein